MKENNINNSVKIVALVLACFLVALIVIIACVGLAYLWNADSDNNELQSSYKIENTSDESDEASETHIVIDINKIALSNESVIICKMICAAIIICGSLICSSLIICHLIKGYVKFKK